jgi:hypothetical protein
LCDGQISQNGKKDAPKDLDQGQTFPLRSLPQAQSQTGQDSGPVVLPDVPACGRGTAMPFVMCSVDGCSRKLQPIMKVDPRDRDTWHYRECDVCLRPVCAKHSSETGGRIVCDRCRRETEAARPTEGLIDLGLRSRPEPT